MNKVIYSEEFRAGRRAYYQKNRQRILRYRKKRQPERWVRQYGLTMADVIKLMELQGHKCAVCGVPINRENRHIDHDHKTDKVRGLLCRRCNMAIGLFEDDYRILQKAVLYLARFV